jgi:hypothetical protein
MEVRRYPPIVRFVITLHLYLDLICLYSPATTPSFTIAIIHDSISHGSRPLGSVTLSSRTILDHSVKQVSGCVRYDLQGFQHPRYSTAVTALQVQFSKEVTGGPPLEIGPVFFADLYAYVTDGTLSGYHDPRGMVRQLYSYILKMN